MNRANEGRREREEKERKRKRRMDSRQERSNSVPESSDTSSPSVIPNITSDDDEDVSSLDFQVSETCTNCQRSGLPCTTVNQKDMHFRRKWASGVALYFKQNDQCDTTVLCDACRQYITNPKSKNGDGSLVWQCYLYKKLTYHPERRRLWIIMPRKLREWWINYVRSLPETNNISLEYPEPATRDGTPMIEKTRNIRANLGNTTWVDFVADWENHQSLPRVRCPWGCSEFYGNVNTIAFDVFIDWYLKGSTEFYSSESERRCSIGFRKNVLSSPVHILNNPNPAWRCLITLQFIDGKEIRVCTCRHHSSKDILDYVHPPTNPTGAITFQGDNDLAQVVVIPRTVRPFQAKSYSHSYQLNRAMGTYTGIDTVDLCDQLDFGEHERSHLSFVRDMIAVNQRVDYRSFMSNLPKKDHQVTRQHANSFIGKSDELCEFQEEAFREQKIGATYVPLEDVFNIQMQMKLEGSRSIVHIDQENGNNRSTNFLPAWPRRILRVMPASSEYGSEFRCCQGFQKKEVFFWFVINISHIVPELWHSLDSTVKTNRDWEGWVLTYIVSNVFPNKAIRTNRNNPFPSKGLSAKKILERLMSGLDDPMLSLFSGMKKLFSRNTNVRVVNTPRDEEIPQNVRAIIAVCDEES